MTRGCTDGAAGALHLGARLCRAHLPLSSSLWAPSLALPASALTAKELRWEGRGGWRGGADGAAAAVLEAAGDALLSTAAGEAGCSPCWSGCGAGAGRLEGLCLQMDHEMGWMRMAHTLSSFSVVWTQKPRQRSSRDTGHSHARRQAHTARTHRGQSEEDRGRSAQNRSEGGGKAAWCLGLALGAVNKDAAGHQ